MKKVQNLNYRIVGEGYPVVFLHGFLESNTMWKNLVPQLDGLKAVCIELPGHGKSALLEETLSLKNITQAVKSTIESLGLKEFSVIGHSMGGYVALHLAEEMSAEINQLILFHSHPWADSEEKKKDRNRAAKIVEEHKIFFLKESIPNLYYKAAPFEKEINAQIEEAYEMSESAIIQSLLAMRDREDKTNVLQKWKDKLHVIQGEFDPLIDAKRMKEETQVFGNHFYEINSIGHMGYNERNGEVIQILKQLL